MTSILHLTDYLASATYDDDRDDLVEDYMPWSEMDDEASLLHEEARYEAGRDD